jgi:putative spermidine/putrescine transport system substrate-binding protein
MGAIPGETVTASFLRPAVFAGGLVLTAFAIGACGAAPAAETGGSAGGKNAATATSAADLGGLQGLVTAAKKEGTLNAIALPRDWANYGAVIDGFTKKYGIKINDENPDGSSQDEINAITSRKGQGRAPDVVDLGSSFALSAAQQGLLAPYKVSTFDQIPAGQKDTQARWYNDYGGYISIGCDGKKVQQCPKTFADLLKPQYKGQVALNGDPNKSGSAFGGVYAAALANGGSFDDIKPGLDFFGKLKKSGNYNPVESTPATVEKGETPISIDWDYLNASYADEFKAKGVEWQVAVPTDGQFAQYYSQGINKDAPHPAASRLWQEYLYSAEGQNLFLKGYARPAEMTGMQQGGTLDQAAAAKLPAVSGAPTFPTDAQQAKAKQVLAQSWSHAVSG